MRCFASIELGDDRIPDETTILNFRYLLERHELTEALFAEVNQAARRDLALETALAKLDRFDLIVLDDIGYAQKDQAETSVLFELIARRYETRSLAIAANQPFSAWDRV